MNYGEAWHSFSCNVKQTWLISRCQTQDQDDHSTCVYISRKNLVAGVYCFTSQAKYFVFYENSWKFELNWIEIYYKSPIATNASETQSFLIFYIFTFFFFFPSSVFSGINVRPFGCGASLVVVHLPDFYLGFGLIITFPANTEGDNETYHPILIWEENLKRVVLLPEKLNTNFFIKQSRTRFFVLFAV
jgi:hypothetical protein